MTVKTEDFRGDIYKNDKNAELRCCPSPIEVLNSIFCQVCKTRFGPFESGESSRVGIEKFSPLMAPRKNELTLVILWELLRRMLIMMIHDGTILLTHIHFATMINFFA